MAYWGVAMSNFHSLWAPPSPTELKVGTEAIAIARLLEKTSRENDYIEAIGKFYDEADKLSHKERITRFANAEKLSVAGPSTGGIEGSAGM